MDEKTADLLFQNKELSDYGRRGLIYKSNLNNKMYLIKQKKPQSKSPGTIENEYKFNKILNELNIGPKIHHFNQEKDFLIRDFVEGKTLIEWSGSASKKDFLKIIMKIFDQCRKLDLNNINKYELTNPKKDIIVTKNRQPVMIDFERCRYTKKPKNVNQFIQFLTRYHMRVVFEKHNIKIDKFEIIKLGEEYKRNYKKEEFEKILSLLK